MLAQCHHPSTQQWQKIAKALANMKVLLNFLSYSIKTSLNAKNFARHTTRFFFFCAFLSSLMFEFPSSICFTLMESLKCSWELHNLQLLHIIENGGCEDFSVTKSITKCFMHTSKMNIFHACSPCKRIMNSL